MSNSDITTRRPKKIKPDGADGHRGRMFDKFLAAGDNDVLPRDILEMLLYFPIRIRDTRDAAVALMKKYGSADKVLSASREDLSATEGVGEGSAAFLQMVGSAVRRLSDEPVDERKIYTDASETGELFCHFRQDLRREITCIACFDNAMRLICVDKIADGALTDSKADAHALISFVAEHHGCSVVLARVTPLRTDYPTTTDFDAARRARRLLNTIDVDLIEYFVVSKDEIIESDDFSI